MSERTRIGLIVPAGNGVCEPDMYAMAPRDVVFHTERMFGEQVTEEALGRMNEDVARAVRYLLPAKPRLIAYACTSGSFVGGLGHDEKIARLIGDCSGGLPVVVTSSAVLQALRALGARTLAVASPYPDPLPERLRQFLAGHGFEVLSALGLPTNYSHERAALPPDSAYDLATRAFRPEADAIVLSCTNWRAAEAIARIENDLDRPVVTSNQALLWACLRALGMTGARPGFGRLFGAPGSPTHLIPAASAAGQREDSSCSTSL